MERRQFLGYTAAAGAALMLRPFETFAMGDQKIRLAMIGTGHRGTGFWGRDLLKNFGSAVEFVGLCDKNEGRLAFAKKTLPATCPGFTDFDKMLRETKPDYVIVTTIDGTHDEFI